MHAVCRTACPMDRSSCTDSECIVGYANGKYGGVCICVCNCWHGFHSTGVVCPASAELGVRVRVSVKLDVCMQKKEALSSDMHVLLSDSLKSGVRLNSQRGELYYLSDQRRLAHTTLPAPQS